ncbi:diiron oxygenase [Piscinibacter sp. HJYY11]|uniref:diiron oxygenase n=1 Tax=Piscinibacter sp. HJYY11 TaxID=2801333 RepID=UPI00191CBC67|nr:diiron oxygenase [Piscinibacter sp. HJYY11]MBL0730315.1 diiron oxygenase [Piscinibacter sp. HJYY11]
METASELAVRLTKASRKKFWDVYNFVEWPEALQADVWYMPPELISIYGTPAWESLTEEQQKRLSLYELGNFFSLVLQGERPLVAGLVDRLYAKGNTTSVNEYLHHFVDEENKHMVMFGEFCNRYVGKVYPEKKIVLPREYAKGEEEVAFYCKVMVVEELGDFYNLAIEKDERCDPLVREINKVHHIDEARHLAFGRVQLAELFNKFAPAWSAETLAGFRQWLGDYLRASWGDYYNPTMYRDAGLADSYELRQMAMSHPVCAEFRRKASSKVVNYFIKNGLLAEEPAF